VRHIARFTTMMGLLKRSLKNPHRLLEGPQQRVDDLYDRLPRALQSRLQRAHLYYHHIARRLTSPGLQCARAQHTLHTLHLRLQQAVKKHVGLKHMQLRLIAQRHTPLLIHHSLHKKEAHVGGLVRLLDSLSYKGVLNRGFALVSDGQGSIITTSIQGQSCDVLHLTFKDGSLEVAPRLKTP